MNNINNLKNTEMYEVINMKNKFGELIYKCPICNSVSGTYIVKSRDPKYFTHIYNCPNSDKIPMEKNQKINETLNKSFKYKGLDDLNNKSLNILNKSIESGLIKNYVEHVFTDKDTKRRLSYSEMRGLYG